MKPNSFSERGQVLIIITFAMIGLFALTALAIDGSAKFSDRRHAQNAADTASLAGALSKVNDGTWEQWTTAARQRASDNGYNGDLVTNQVWVYDCLNRDPDSPVDCGAYNGNPDYIQVAILSHVNTFFARVIGVNQTQNTVQAVAYAVVRGPFYRGDSIVALNPDPSCPGSFLVGGSGTINLSGGGMYINSDNPDCVWEQQGCNVTVNVTGVNGAGDPAAITSAGGSIDIDPSCAEQINSTTSTGGDQYAFPPEMPDEPSECTSPAGTYTSNSATKKTILYPGRFNEFPPKGTKAKPVFDDIEMTPGIYCVNTVLKLVDQKLYLHGSDVLIYIRPGYYFSLEGGSFDLHGRESGPYAGYLMVVASNFSGSPTNCKIDGNADNDFTGTIFAPYCNVTINGTSENTAYNAQIVAYEVKLNGNNVMDFTYNPDDNRWNEPKIGLMR